MCLCNDEAAARAGRRAVAIGATIEGIRRKLCNQQAGKVEDRIGELARLHAIDATAKAWAEELIVESTTRARRESLLLGLRRMLSVRHNGEITTALSHRLSDKSSLLSQVAAAIEFHAFRTVRPSTVVQPPRWVTPV